MNKQWLVKYGSILGLKAVEWRLPFAEMAVRNTIFEQFCGGTTLLGCKDEIEHLWKYDTLTILDYGAEAKETENDFNGTMNEAVRAVHFAATLASVPVVVSKISGLARFQLLEKISADQPLTDSEKQEWESVIKRIDAICYAGREKGIAIFIDGEESWIQQAIDDLADKMMARYNKEKVIVYNTYQLYRHDRLRFLHDSYALAQQGGYLLGAKLVRGAYMEKERKRAAEKGYQSPINPDKAATDRMYNEAVRFCVENYTQIGSCCASHNIESSMLQATLIAEKGIPKTHPHLNFSQLYGMSDNITFNIAKAGYNVAKYLPYGQIREVIPYLIRRAQENSAVSGEMSREYALIVSEVNRRKL